MNMINRIPVFSVLQRLTHGVIALGVLFELSSAWLIQHSDVDVLAWSDWHAMVGQVLLLTILLRIGLLFRNESGHWRFLIPTREQRHVVLQTLKFYASLGRLPCPDWYAFNPVWQPIYLLMIFILLLTALSGFMLGKLLMIGGVTMTEIHLSVASLVLYFTLAHIVFAIWHDVKGNGAQISAMMNGYKYFHIGKADAPAQENSVSVDSLVKKK